MSLIFCFFRGGAALFVITHCFLARTLQERKPQATAKAKADATTEKLLAGLASKEKFDEVQPEEDSTDPEPEASGTEFKCCDLI